MNKKFLILLALFISIQTFSQSEFETYKNGLIYSENTMNKLERIVDSLNLKYKTCDLSKKFYSKYQTIGHIINIDSINVKQAKEDMDNNISFESFALKYPNSKIQKNVLVVKYKYENYKNEERHGVYKWYCENGKLRSESNYENGELISDKIY